MQKKNIVKLLIKVGKIKKVHIVINSMVVSCCWHTDTTDFSEFCHREHNLYLIGSTPGASPCMLPSLRQLARQKCGGRKKSLAVFQSYALKLYFWG